MITLLSFCGYSLVALAIHYNPSLQVHPMKLIYYTCIVDAMLIMNVFSSYYVCDLKLYKLAAWTIYFSNSEHAQWLALKLL